MPVAMLSKQMRDREAICKFGSAMSPRHCYLPCLVEALTVVGDATTQSEAPGAYSTFVKALHQRCGKTFFLFGKTQFSL